MIDAPDLSAEHRRELTRSAHRAMGRLSGSISPVYPLAVVGIGFGGGLHRLSSFYFLALLLTVILLAAFRMVITRRFDAYYDRHPVAWLHLFRYNLLAIGVLWSTTACWTLAIHGMTGVGVFGLLFSITMAALSLDTLAPDLWLIRSFFFVVLVPLACTFPFGEDWGERALVLFIIPYGFHLWRLSRRLHREYWEHAIETKRHVLRSEEYEQERDRLTEIRQRLEAEVEMRVADYRQIFENAHDAIIVLDPEDETVLNVNQRACDLYGFRRDDFIGLSMRRLTQGEAGPEHVERTIRQADPYHFETHQTRSDGREMILEISAATFEYQGRKAILSINRDITERKQTEEQLEQHRQRLEELVAERTEALEEALANLEQQNAKLQTRAAEMERFSYTISHDLKSPLITISSFLGFLERDAERGDHSRMRRDIRRIQSAVTSMGNLLEDLLELSRLGRLVNPPEPIPLESLVREAVDLLAGPIRERGVQVEVVDSPLPIIAGDRVRWLEVVQNLIENAVKFMADQARPEIRIGLERHDDQPTLYIRDNGIGIEPAYHERIFGLFDRLHDQEIEGTGVGLALVKRIVELHEQRIWVESEGDGRGSTFYITLPGVPETPPQQGAVGPPRRRKRAPPAGP